MSEFIDKILADSQSAKLIFYVAVVLFIGLIFGRIAKLVKLPNVTGYTVAGLLFGPFVLKIIPADIASGFTVFADVALSFIAFIIGSSFKKSYLKRVGATPVVIAVFEGVMASLVTIAVIYLVSGNLVLALLLGAIASATAPNATMLVIKQYNANGNFTDCLLSVVAIDDAIAIFCFGISSAIATAITGSAGTSMLVTVLTPFYEIFGSLLLGFLVGLIFNLPLKFFKKKSNRTILVVAFIFICNALAVMLDMSALLACMAFGATFINIRPDAKQILDIVDNLTPPINVLFFVISGAQLDITVLAVVGIVGVAYMFARVAGKMLGSFTGACVMKAEPSIKKYLGFALVPQAGVAIGLSLLVASDLPELGAEVRAIVLAGTLIFEVFGPMLSKFALSKAGDLNRQPVIEEIKN